MIEKGTVILDLQEYDRLHLLEQKHMALLDSILEYSQENKRLEPFDFEVGEKASYITISKELLMDLLDTCVDDIRLR